MGLGRRLMTVPAVEALVTGAIAAYVRLVWATNRWEFRGLDHPEPHWRDGTPLIGAFWHGRLLMMPKIWRGGKRVHVLISQSRDGEMIARAVGHFGIGTIRGSTRRGDRDKGGSAAVRSIMRAVQAGESICITPDGPKGPRMRASAGVVAVARLAGVPVFPASYSTSRAIRMKSWDRFHLPLPFGHGVFVVAPPVAVPRDADDAEQDRLRLVVEATLNRITDEADRACGQPSVEPARPSDARA